MVFNVHAGHAPAGGRGCGAVGYLNESTVARQVKDEVIRILRQNGHKVYDTTYNKNATAGTVLRGIVSACNKHKVDLDVSIHFNALKASASDGRVKGTECWVFPRLNDRAVKAGGRICSAMKKLGFTDRGVKFSSGLYFLKKTNAQALLIEVCFVDDEDDYRLYMETGYKKVAQAIAEGLEKCR